MPFTIAHAAAALPLRKTRLVLSALVIGTMVPDLQYFLRMAPDDRYGHSLRGALLLSLPLGLLTLWGLSPGRQGSSVVWRQLLWLGVGLAALVFMAAYPDAALLHACGNIPRRGRAVRTKDSAQYAIKEAPRQPTRRPTCRG